MQKQQVQKQPLAELFDQFPKLLDVRLKYAHGTVEIIEMNWMGNGWFDEALAKETARALLAGKAARQTIETYERITNPLWL